MAKRPCTFLLLLASSAASAATSGAALDQMMIRQLTLSQQAMEETLRSQGQSGLTKHLDKHKAVANIHDHSNLVRTLGMGEVDIVMNGVHFKTRHNDYKLTMPHRTSSAWEATEEIPFPEVPPAVADPSLTTDEQILEMREWFKAWQAQDHSERDYREYFKPNLCYLEGNWVVDDDTPEPLVANWEYRILCQPVTDVPLSMLKPVESLDEQVGAVTPPRSKAEGVRRTRSTRFELALEDGQKR